MVLEYLHIFTNIYPINGPNVDKYTIHGAYGLQMIDIPLKYQAPLSIAPSSDALGQRVKRGAKRAFSEFLISRYLEVPGIHQDLHI